VRKELRRIRNAILDARAAKPAAGESGVPPV
jgi:hypothetical protein